MHARCVQLVDLLRGGTVDSPLIENATSVAKLPRAASEHGQAQQRDAWLEVCIQEALAAMEAGRRRALEDEVGRLVWNWSEILLFDVVAHHYWSFHSRIIRSVTRCIGVFLRSRQTATAGAMQSPGRITPKPLKVFFCCMIHPKHFARFDLLLVYVPPNGCNKFSRAHHHPTSRRRSLLVVFESNFCHTNSARVASGTAPRLVSQMAIWKTSAPCEGSWLRLIGKSRLFVFMSRICAPASNLVAHLKLGRAE